MLTPEERAEKLTPTGQPHNVDSPEGLNIFRQAIADQIRAAVWDFALKIREAAGESDNEWMAYVNEVKQAAKVGAYKECAKIAEELECDPYTGKPFTQIRDKILALIPPKRTR